MSRAKLYKGYTRKIIRVNLTDGSIHIEEMPNGQLMKYIGGAGLAARMLYDELEPGIDPLSYRNKVIFLAGPLAGTSAPTGSRIGAYTKSPMTNGFFHSSAGGSFAAELKFAGFDGVVIEGRSEKPVYLFITNDRVELRDAAHLWGERTYRAHELLKSDIGDEAAQIAVIGPAGERLVRFASVIVRRQGPRARRFGRGAGLKKVQRHCRARQRRHRGRQYGGDPAKDRRSFCGSCAAIRPQARYCRASARRCW